MGLGWDCITYITPIWFETSVEISDSTGMETLNWISSYLKDVVENCSTFFPVGLGFLEEAGG